MATQSWPAFLPTCRGVCSRSWMPLRGWSSAYDVQIIVSDALISLHWLHIPQRIQFKVAMLTYNVLHDCAPSYLGPFVRVADLPSRRALRSANTDRLIRPQYNRSTIGDPAFPVAGPHRSEIVCHRRSHQRHLSTTSVSVWRLTCSPCLNRT